MERKPELRLPTTAVPVTLQLVAAPREWLKVRSLMAELFVAEAARAGHSQLLDDVAALLDENATFIPVRIEGLVQLYSKAAILYVSVARTEEPDEDAEFADGPSEVITLYDRQHHVKVELIGEGAIVGTLFDSSPADRPRVMDHLNRSGRFLRLWTASRHYLINKDQIIRVSEQE